jgi:hypothetical protein
MPRALQDAFVFNPFLGGEPRDRAETPARPFPTVSKCGADAGRILAGSTFAVLRLLVDAGASMPKWDCGIAPRKVYFGNRTLNRAQ